MTSRIESFQKGERLSRDRLNEIVDAANYAARPTSSDPATVSQTAFGWHVAVAAQGAAELVVLDAALPAGGDGVAAKVQRRDLDAGTMVAAEEGVRDLFDFGCGPLLPDTLATATWLPSGGGRIVAPALNWHLAELTEELIAGGTANARLWTHDGGGGHADAGLNVTAWDWMLGGGESLATGSRVVVQFHPATRRWYALRSVGGGGAGETANPLVLFELTSTLAPGGTATAKELAWGGSAYGVVGSDFSIADPTD
ncbi:MAG: hypothetical protein KDA41_18820, partial [Planctomycetales bacterium]|nr:hypothetical protein [Planctomycetales bacterium]